MSDTPPDVGRLYARMLMGRPGTDRLRMGFDMFDAARRIVLASLGDCPPRESRERLFLRFYGADFPPEVRARIMARIRAHTVGGPGSAPAPSAPRSPPEPA